MRSTLTHEGHGEILSSDLKELTDIAGDLTVQMIRRKDEFPTLSYSGGRQKDQDAVPEWWIGVAHECPFFAPSQWFKSGRAKVVVREAFAAIEAAVRDHPAITVLKVVPA